MTNTITSIKFHATTEQLQDVVIWMDDVEESVKEIGMEETIQAILDKVLVGEWKNLGTIHVVDDQKEIGQAFAAVLNTKYEEELVLMNQANVARKEVEEVVAPKKALRSGAKAKKFLEEQAAKLANAKQSPLKNKSEEEKAMTTETNEVKQASSIRRKKAVTKTEGETTMTKNTTVPTVKEKAAALKEKHAAKDTGKKPLSNRKSSGETKAPVGKKAPAATGKMGRDEPQGQTTWVKFEGPWYLNSSRYEVLKRLPQIIEDRADMELGITAITFSNHTDVAKYKNKRDLVAVEQFQASGAILDFPIKLNAMGDKVSSPSIGWVEYNGKRYPRFGFYRPNTLSVDFTCGCGTKNTNAGTENMYCSGCKKVWADVAVEVEDNYGFDFDLTGSLDMDGNKKEGTPWMFQEVPNMKVSEETLVLALALAHFDQGLDMWDLIDFEDAE